MKRRLFLAGSCIAVAGGAVAADDKAFRNLAWEELMPKGWDPMKRFRDNPSLGSLSDGDPQAQQMLLELREVWDNAPTNDALDNAAVKLPGYVVPLEESKGELREFLLVPYFGACIHTPPPPANQIVHVVAAPPAKGFRAMDTVWVSGTLKTSRRGSSMGTSGYRLDASVVERYAPPAR